jgi:hypothetical protein
MKLGNPIFYTIEAKRQNYLGSLEAFPYLGGFLSMFYFAYFAIKRPINLKLYKEFF